MSKQPITRVISHDFPTQNVGPARPQDLSNLLHEGIAFHFNLGIDKFVGDMLTLIDYMDLPEVRAKAAKDLFKRFFYDRYDKTTNGLLNLLFAVEEVLEIDNPDGFKLFSPEYNKTIYTKGGIRHLE
jgi:hypothetical protein